jgi:histidine triad (HIT) family protein
MTDPDCIFCKIINGKIPALKVYEDAKTFAFLDIAPFEKGHVLVVPKYHTAFLTDLPQPELLPFISAVQRVADTVLKKLPCDGFNLIQNNGPCATQVVPHVHFHIVPRWNGQPVNWTPRMYDDPNELNAIHRRLAV